MPSIIVKNYTVFCSDSYFFLFYYFYIRILFS